MGHGACEEDGRMTADLEQRKRDLRQKQSLPLEGKSMGVTRSRAGQLVDEARRTIKARWRA